MRPMTDALPTLAIFTTAYPRGRGETFLTAELERLAPCFERVILVPRWREEGMRPMPANCELDESLSLRAAQPTRHLRYALRPIARPSSWRDAARLALQASPEGLAHLATMLDQARLVERWVRRAITQGRTSAAGTVFYSYWLSGAALGLSRAARKQGIRAVARAHGSDLYDHAVPWGRHPLRAQTLAGLDAVYAVSDDGRDYLRAAAGDRASIVQTARLGVHIPQGLARASEDGVWRVLSCSNLIEVKRVDHLIEALAEVGPLLPGRRVEWTHLGDGPLRSELEARAAAVLGPTGVVWRWVGALPHERVLAWYDEQPVDVMVNTSRSEGLPVALMEALARGVPVVAPDVGGVREAVPVGGGALTSAGAPPREVARAIAQLAVGDVQVARRAARGHAEACFDAHRNFAAFAQALVALARRPKGEA